MFQIRSSKKSPSLIADTPTLKTFWVNILSQASGAPVQRMGTLLAGTLI